MVQPICSLVPVRQKVRKPTGRFEALFRFYRPEKALFDKTWKLPDIEEVK